MPLRRLLTLAALTLALLLAVLVLPTQPPKPQPLTPPQVEPESLTLQEPQSSDGALSLFTRPARTAFSASGDEFDVLLELRARAGEARRSPVDFVLVLDRSGSMSGEPLQKAKEAARALVSRLGDDDRLALVHFGTDVKTGLSLSAMSAEGREKAMKAIARVEDDGGTNISDALSLAAKVLAESPRPGAVPRVVLLSDGEANEGLEKAALVTHARTLSNRSSLSISALGLGTSFDEDTMFGIAMSAGGQYRYLKDADELGSALSEELSKAGATAASHVRMKLFPSAGVQVLGVLGYEPSTREGALHFGVRDLSVGETRRVVVRVKTDAGREGSRSLFEVRADYVDVGNERRETALRSLASALATLDAPTLEKSWDKEAAEVGLKARWSLSVLDAARDYETKGAGSASAGLEAEAKKLEAEADAIGLGAVSSLIDSAKRSLSSGMSAPASAPAGRAQSKAIKSYAIDNAGL